MLDTANTQTELWVNLLRKAQNKRLVTLSELQESYLVFMLQRFMERKDLVEIVFALKYLESTEKIRHQKSVVLSDLADGGLLFAGLFPERASRLHVSSRYFRDMSQICFFDLAEVCTQLKHLGEAVLYKELGRTIDLLISVLLCIRRSDIDILIPTGENI